MIDRDDDKQMGDDCCGNEGGHDDGNYKRWK